MLLEAESGRLYVGARGAAFALDASNISASTGLTVSLFCSHVVGGWRCAAPRQPKPSTL